MVVNVVDGMFYVATIPQCLTTKLDTLAHQGALMMARLLDCGTALAGHARSFLMTNCRNAKFYRSLPHAINNGALT